MAVPAKAERALLAHDESEIVRRTHYPDLMDLDDRALPELRQRIRDLRAKEGTLVRELRRGIRGKGKVRGANFPGNVEKPSRRKQIFASALKRLNSELARRRAIRASAELIVSARRAWMMKTQAGVPERPKPDRTIRSGMTPIPSTRVRTRVDRARIGRAIHATKAVQAARDTQIPNS
jgi:hypothetical protein